MGGFADGTMHYVSAQRPPALLAMMLSRSEWFWSPATKSSATTRGHGGSLDATDPTKGNLDGSGIIGSSILSEHRWLADLCPHPLRLGRQV